MNHCQSVLPAAFLLSAALALPTPSFAVQGDMGSSVLSVLITSNPLPPPATGLYYGGCMARLADAISSASNSPNCPYNWVAFSCDGTYAPKDIAQTMLDQAQLALSLKKPVYIVVDDTKLHNGYCTAVRFDISQ